MLLELVKERRPCVTVCLRGARGPTVVDAGGEPSLKLHRSTEECLHAARWLACVKRGAARSGPGGSPAMRARNAAAGWGRPGSLNLAGNARLPMATWGSSLYWDSMMLWQCTLRAHLVGPSVVKGCPGWCVYTAAVERGRPARGACTAQHATPCSSLKACERARRSLQGRATQFGGREGGLRVAALARELTESLTAPAGADVLA